MAQRSRLSLGAICLLAFICFSFIGTTYAQAAVVILDTPPYPAYQYGGSGSYSASANKNTGYVYASCSGNAYARAGVAADNHYTGPGISQIRILITVTDGYAQRNGAYGCTCEAKLWIRLIDLTTSQVLYEAEQDVQTQSGAIDYYFPQSGCRQQNIYNEHDYECWAGVVTRTSSFLWWSSSATARGSITLIKVYQCGL